MASESIELLNCPFCGSDNISMVDDGELFWTMCGDCDCEGPIGDSEADATMLWNMREG